MDVTMRTAEADKNTGPAIGDTEITDARARAAAALKNAGLVVTDEEIAAMEIADFGLGDLNNIGLEIVVYVNTNRVCAKELVLFPGQACPEHRHPPAGDRDGKEETFRCRAGTVYLYIEGTPNCAPYTRGLENYADYLTVSHEIILQSGEQYTLAPDVLHWFRAGENGAVVSEFSTTSTDENDVFTDPRIKRVAEA